MWAVIMELVSVTLPRKLSSRLREKAQEIGTFPEELTVELILQGLNEELDPEELVEHYQALSEKYLAEARELLKRGDLVQTSEKLWGATALAVKAVAAKRGLKLERHGSLWNFVSKLSKEKGDENIITLFIVANGLHRNFYEDQMNKESLEVAIKNIEQLIGKLRGF
ncbi:PaREP1 family protein [Candidatus Poribacteria bacterium]|nr:PaREP1 family protein [Candidatus Poribacteria bacterium]